MLRWNVEVTFRKNLYTDLQTLQKDLDEWTNFYINERTHQGKMCCGRTPMRTLTEGKKSGRKINLSKITSYQVDKPQQSRPGNLILLISKIPI